MGNAHTIFNETQYRWFYRSNWRDDTDRTLDPFDSAEYLNTLVPFNKLQLRFRDHADWDLKCEGGGASYTLRESSDHKQFELVNNLSGIIVDKCPNFGKLEEEERENEKRQREKEERERREREQHQQEEAQRREEEEKRRLAEQEREEKIQEQLEREEKIQEQLERENEATRGKLSEAHQRMEEKLRGRRRQQQQSQILQRLEGRHRTRTERDELADVRLQFERLLSDFHIEETLDSQAGLAERLKRLQDELVLKFFRERRIPVWSQSAVDRATAYVDLSLTERLSVVRAVVKVSVEADPDPEDGQDQKIQFLLSLQEKLYDDNPTLARQVLVNVLDMTPELTTRSKETLSLMLFNNIWTPKEIKLFVGRASGLDGGRVAEVLHAACTYRLSLLHGLSALRDQHHPRYLQGCVSYELDKDADTILSEMQDRKYPESALSLLEDVLLHMEDALPQLRRVEIYEEMIEEGKKMMVSLDLDDPDVDSLKGVLVVLSLAVKRCTALISQDGDLVQGYVPRLTQLASLLLLLLPQFRDKTGSLLEIGTGEGKTCILSMFATIQATRGAAVDVVTSSPLLAIRDQDQWRKLYEMFDVTSSVVPPPHFYTCTPENQDKLLQDAYSKQVVYGTVSTFAADILRQEFEKKTTRGGRKSECVLVDEVDYMTLDSGVQVTFLSRQASGLRHVEQILAGIWAMLCTCRPIEMSGTGEVQWGTRTQHFHKVAVQSVVSSDDVSADSILHLGVQRGFYSQEDLDRFMEAEASADGCKDATEDIMDQMGPKEQFELLSEVQTTAGVDVEFYSVVDNKAKLYGEDAARDPDVTLLLLERGRACEILSEKSIIERTVETLKSKIRYSDACDLNSPEESAGFIVVPSFLKTYVENQLPVFAENGLNAIRMTLGREYMIDTAPEADRGTFSQADSHQYDAIIPVDFQASGVLEKNRRWGEGLQQFLEMKHQLAVSQLSNVTNYMSNVHFFKRYISGKGIFGVSGTLGGSAEKAFLERNYLTATYVIPSHRHKKVVELPASQVAGKPRWIQVICDTAWRAADRGQVVLIICEDVNTANELQAKMQVQVRKPDQISMYTISVKHNIEKQSFSQGHVIIATNLGGRGTDIHVQPEVNACGGLFVLLTYFPGSHRVERQIFGRTARKGNPGMVQMVLDRDRLAPAYQSQAVETMRQLREQDEVSRLQRMEQDELLEVEMKETLFSTFCDFLCAFDKNYSEEEKRDLTKMKLKDVPACFKTHRKKFDYQTALNALKESWALWLILHEGHIRSHDNIEVLKEDLTALLQRTGERLLQGTSDNFYDYVIQAKSRTDLYCVDKKSCDFGALRFWQRAAESDRFYGAVALYNEAYVTIRLAGKDHVARGKRLLEKAKAGVDVYLSEATNTMMFCNLSATAQFTPHHTERNLQAQMQARMNIYKSWKGYIENALDVLTKLESSKEEAVVEDSSVYTLSKDKDPITTNELMVLYEYGLGIVFEVKRKPEFSYDALACFALGVIQVAAGVLVCTLSCGTASQFGLGLISEGVSDMIHGIRGMIQGSFDWAQWAIAKAISIGVSLVFGGLSRLRKAVGAVRAGAKGLIAGAKCTSTITVKQCFKQATKYAVQELGKQGFLSVLGHVVDKGLSAVFHKVLTMAFKEKVFTMIEENRLLDEALTDFVCSGVPKTALQNQGSGFKVDKRCEDQMCQSVNVMTKQVIPELMLDCTVVMKGLDTLSQVCGLVSQHTQSQKRFNQMQHIMLCAEGAKFITECVQILNSFPTERVINKKFVPQFLQTMKNLSVEKYDHDGRGDLSDVKRLKQEVTTSIAQSVTDSFVEACSRHMMTITTRACMSSINRAAGGAVSNLLGRADTQSFFDQQVYKHSLQGAVSAPCERPTEAEAEDLACYVDQICDVNRPATSLDLHVLSQSQVLEGKGIRLVMVDKHGKKLSEDYYPGTDGSAGDIVLQLRRDPEDPQKSHSVFSKLTSRIRGEQSPYSGHFEILSPDGAVIPVQSEGQNCLYHAVVQATGRDGDLRQEAASLRTDVKHSLQQNVDRYAAALKLQRGYEETYRSPGKYYVSGGGLKTQKEIKKKYKDSLNASNLDKDDAATVQLYHLGMVGTMHDIKAIRRENGQNNNNINNNSPVNADHIPPKNSLKTAHRWLQDPQNRDRAQELQNQNPKLFAMLTASGNQGLVREVLTQHHQQILTTGRYAECERVREKLTHTALSGDVQKLLKLSLIASSPEMSESLRNDAGISRSWREADLQFSGRSTRKYHDMGDRLLVEGYHRRGLLDQGAKDNLLSWLGSNGLYEKNTDEYKELLNVIRRNQRD